MKPAIRGSAASARMASRSAPSAKIFTWRSSITRRNVLARRRESRAPAAPQISGHARPARPRRAACERCRAVDQDRRAAGRAPGENVAVGVADHPRAARSMPSRRAAASSIPGAGLRHSHAPVSSGPPRPGGEGRGGSRRTHALAPSSSSTRAWTAWSRSSETTPFAAAGWLETPTSSQPASASRCSAAAAPGDQRDVRRRSGDSGRPLTGSATSSLIDAVAVDEDRAGALTTRLAASDSQ